MPLRYKLISGNYHYCAIFARSGWRSPGLFARTSEDLTLFVCRLSPNQCPHARKLGTGTGKAKRTSGIAHQSRKVFPRYSRTTCSYLTRTKSALCGDRQPVGIQTPGPDFLIPTFIMLRSVVRLRAYAYLGFRSLAEYRDAQVVP